MRESKFEKIRNKLQAIFFVIERLKEGDVVAPKIIDVAYNNLEGVRLDLIELEKKQIERDKILNS
ncbi:MAG: hypothetical protein CMH22_05805 [Methylophaga sp.]|nr:hypothetical protein [Methylophaga sp.]|tara:strand:+ start:86196 stop:86390 length:195 start_codon:yes stop_codon:yes gene_type:complete